MSAESTRRRSSICPKRISLLPSEINEDQDASIKKCTIPKSEIKKTASCIKSTLAALNAEYAQTSGFCFFPENLDLIVENIIKDLDGSTDDKLVKSKIDTTADDSCNSTSTTTNASVNVRFDNVQSRIDKIASLKEEKCKWEMILKKYNEEEATYRSQENQITIKYKDVPNNIKMKANQSKLATSPFSFNDVLTKCCSRVNKTMLVKEEFLDKIHQLKKIQSKCAALVDSQFEKFTSSSVSSLQDTSLLSTDDDGIRQHLKNRIAILSPMNDKKIN